MSRRKYQHPDGKISLGKRRELKLPIPLDKKLEHVAMIDGKDATEWARDALEVAIEGRWAFIVKRVGPAKGDDNGGNPG